MWRVWRSRRIGWSLFFCLFSVRVLKLNCFTQPRRNLTFHLSFFSFFSPLLSLSHSLHHLLYQLPVPVEATNVSAICVGANSLVIVICVSLLLLLLLLLLLRKSWSSRKGVGGEGGREKVFLLDRQHDPIVCCLIWCGPNAMQRNVTSFNSPPASSPISDILTSCQTIWWARVEFNYVTYIVERRAIKAINPSNAPYRLHEPTRLASPRKAEKAPLKSDDVYRQFRGKNEWRFKLKLEMK